ncbi:hypothetical protein FB472_1170 [Rhodoglobus vestalii]|uniref:Nucleotidyltransferase n=1 Tax=Rhodoglobus vestalii TaxID=193384 RepID=A0A8H2K4G5_9MICO|nr:hypothetical protein [Rhodoglobus vestalii]TQO19603.1 hypothetical protein FB472_1170 [Rhodoglobus vestalii]
MKTIDDLLDEVRVQIEPTSGPLDEARARLTLVRDSADSFPGALRTYRSGSLAVHTMNKPVTDGDGGLVLNRNYYPQLGPDGAGEAPGAVVDDLCAHLGTLIRKQYPNATIHKSKRGPEVHFGAPIEDQDPTVDLVVALNRKNGSGIWIPNLEDEDWDASDPEKHVGLLNSGSSSFRSIRRKTIRLAKAWNKQFVEPGMSSFQLSVWAWEFLEPGTGVAHGLHTLFDRAASRLEAGEGTSDPAGVSDDLKLLKDADVVATCLRKASNSIAEALDADNEDELRSAVSAVFSKYLDVPSASALKESARLLSTAKPVAAAALGVAVAATTTAGARAFGGTR